MPVSIFPRVSEKWQVCHPTEIVRRFYSMAGFWEINLQGELPKLAPNKAFHSLAHGGAEIQGWQANRGLCSIRAIVISWLKNPVTNPFLSAIFAPVSRLNSLEHPSRTETVTGTSKTSVFTHTRMARRFNLRGSGICANTEQVQQANDFLKEAEQ
jgi:hypothetical protein